MPDRSEGGLSQIGELFRALGEEVETLWRERRFVEDEFPELARSVLEERRLCERLDPVSILAWAAGAPRLPRQRNLLSGFGQPPICVFESEHFYIEALFWFDGTTSIHEHGFAGAFTVAAGSSVHTRYTFSEAERLSSRLRLGQVRFERAELLATGACRAISPGSGFIHGLFHLDRPSVTLVVRTYRLPAHQPQLEYRAPSLALDPTHLPEALQRRLEALEALEALAPAAARRAALEILNQGDFFAACRLLEQWVVKRADENVLAELLERTRRRFGERAAVLPAVLEEERRQRNLLARRAAIRDPDHRFFLALLLNLPDQSSILRRIEERHPERDPVEVAVGWIAELLARPPEDRAELGENVLGIPSHQAIPAVCEGLLRGRSEERIARASAASPGEVAKLALTLPRTRALRPLFRSEPTDASLAALSGEPSWPRGT